MISKWAFKLTSLLRPPASASFDGKRHHRKFEWLEEAKEATAKCRVRWSTLEMSEEDDGGGCLMSGGGVLILDHCREGFFFFFLKQSTV